MIGWLIETSIAVTLLMLLVLAVRQPVAHFFGAGWAYALWLLPVLRLVLPPLDLFGGAIPSLLPAAPAAVPSGAAAGPMLDAATAVPFDWEPLALAFWLAGSAGFILWQSVSYVAFTRRLGIGSQVHASLAQDVGIIESPEVDGPLAIGLLDRWIVVPADFAARYSRQEQQLALQHERIHHQREDIFWNMVALGVLALNWFNPVAYLAFRAFRTDQELSCDAAVAAMASAEQRHDYALALVKSASKPGLVAACPLNHAGQLKQRLRMMKGHRRSRMRALGGSGVAAVLALVGLSATQSASIAAAEAAPAVATASDTPAPRAMPAPAAKQQVQAAFVPAAPAKPVRKASRAPREKPAIVKVAAASAPSAAVAAVETVAPVPPVEDAAPAQPAAPRALVVRVDDPARFAFFARRLPTPPAVHMVRADIARGEHMPAQLRERLEALLASRPSGVRREIHTIQVTRTGEN